MGANGADELRDGRRVEQVDWVRGDRRRRRAGGRGGVDLEAAGAAAARGMAADEAARAGQQHAPCQSDEPAARRRGRRGSGRQSARRCRRRVVPAHAAGEAGAVGSRHHVEALRCRPRASGSHARSRAGCRARRPFSADSSTPTQRPKRGRTRPQVDRHVEHGAPRAAHQLALRVRLGLPVHAAQRAAPRVEREVALRERRRQPVRGELVGAEASARNGRARRPAARAAISHDAGERELA